MRGDDRIQGQVDVDQPQPQRDRHHQAQDVPHVRVPEAEPESQPDAGAAQQRQGDQELHDRGRQHAPRVHLRTVLERAAAAVDQQHRDDHEVPGHRREGRDAEDALRVEDAGDDAEQPHQHHDREQDPGQRHHQVGGDVAGSDQQHRHQQRRQQDEQGRDRAQHQRGRPQHHAGDPPRLLLLALLAQLQEHRHEGRADGVVGHDRADQVGQVERDREGRVDGARAEHRGGGDLADKTRHPGDGGGHPEDGRGGRQAASICHKRESLDGRSAAPFAFPVL